MATTENGIYYPNEGTKAADVLADLKAMAESIDKNIQENKFDDTEIEKDISSIIQEQIQQNTNIEQLKQENEQLKNALINVETEQSKSLHIEDASTIPAQLEVLGNQKQETREGKNLWNDISIENKKVSELSSTQVSKSNLNLMAGDYCFRLFFTDNTYMQTNINVLLKNNENVTIKTMSVNRYATLTEEEAQQIVSGVCHTNTTGLEEYKSKTIAGLILTKGITFADKYEQYGASPSPDYPSPVICLGSNKNIFDKNSEGLLENTWIFQDGNTGTSSVTNTSDYIDVRGKKYITINYENDNNNRQICFYDSSKQVVLNSLGNLIPPYSVEIPETVNYIKFSYYNKANNVKVEEGKIATSYSPYRTR